MFWVAGLIVATFLLYKWLSSSCTYFEKRGIPHIGTNLIKTVKEALASKPFTDRIEEWASELKDEKISGMFQFMKPMFFIRDPKLLKQLAIRDFDYFPDHTTFLDDKVDKLFGRSLEALTGDKWRDMRSTLSPMFTGSKMRMMFNHVADIGKQGVQTLKDQIIAGGDNVLEFKDLASKFTVDVTASCAFGIEVNSFKEPDNDFAKTAGLVNNFADWKIGLKLLGYFVMRPIMIALKIRIIPEAVDKFFQQAVVETMNIREEKGIVRHDVINLLMQIRQGKLSHEQEDDSVEGFAAVEESNVGKSKVKRVWDDDHLSAQCLLFFFGGFESVSTAMTFMAHEITINSDIQNKLHTEIEAMENKLKGETISYEQIQGLKYMDQVVCETLRKWPSTPMIDRVCVKDYELELDDGRKITIEKGVTLSIPIYAYHHNPEYFPDPKKFDPERFSEENRANIDPDTYLPFGIGPRNCIGSRFALMELKTIFYYLLKNFSFEVTEKTQIPLKLEKNPILLKSEKGVWVGLKPCA